MIIASYLLDKAREKGYAEGREEAYEYVEKQLDAYFKRMRKALEAGEDFDEPRPKFGDNGQ